MRLDNTLAMSTSTAVPKNTGKPSTTKKTSSSKTGDNKTSERKGKVSLLHCLFVLMFLTFHFAVPEPRRAKNRISDQ